MQGILEGARVGGGVLSAVPIRLLYEHREASNPVAS